MKAYLIDPTGRTISEIEIRPNDLSDYYRALECETFTVAVFSDFGDCVYVDDEGLLNGPTAFFLIEGFPQPLAGRGLVLGTDTEGHSAEPKSTIAWLEANVDFGVPVVVGNRVLFMGDRNIREVQ